MSHESSAYPSRRRFLGQSAAGAAAGWGLNVAALAGWAAAPIAAAAESDDYKALVCLWLEGGNDHNNTFVPVDDASYGRYATLRGRGEPSIALARDRLAPTLLSPEVPLPGGRRYALHPEMPGLQRLFQNGRAAVLLNVGPLIVPLTLQQYGSRDKRYPVPAQLFSHSDQRSTFLSGDLEGSSQGYGGAMANTFYASNATPLLTSIGVEHSLFSRGFLQGREVTPYQMTLRGSVPVGPAAVEGGPGSAFASLIQAPRSHALESAYNQIVRLSMATYGVVSSALGNYQPAEGVSSLTNALRLVVRVASARAALGMRRQVFHVSRTGFDTHGGQLAVHSSLLRELSEALVDFDATASAAGLSDKITLFTASDFGRTLTSNGDGTDHGWGGHHVILGGAVKGGRFYGTAPPISVGTSSHPDDQWHVGNGRLLPSTSVAQYMATLALWMGVPMQQLQNVVMDIGNFGSFSGRSDYPVDLGFLRA